MQGLTTKELQALEETMNSEKMLVAKYRAMSETTTDAGLKEKFWQYSNKHQQHFDALSNFLN